MRRLALAALIAGLGCGRIAFDPLGSGGPVVEENLVDRPIIAVGQQFSCVRRGDGSVWCWGDGRQWQLGNGGGELPRVNPARVQGLPGPVIAIETGSNHACAITEDGGEVWCWGYNGFGQVDGSTGINEKPPTRVSLPRPATAVSAGAYHSCALLDDKSVSCWGKNSTGQIGKGPLSGDHALQHDIVAGATAITAGLYHTCAVRDGTVWCWGMNSSGQLGNGTQDSLSTPTSIGITASSVSAGAYFTCALDGGRYRCWGDNGDGQLGTAGSDILSPAPVSALDGFVALRAGGRHTCGIRDDSSLWCWGSNTLGELGDGTGDGAVSGSQVPLQIATGRADVAAGWDHTCAAHLDGAVTCWGVNSFGAVGDAARTAKLRPQEVTLPDAASTLVAGSRFACAIVGPGQNMYCWGQNGSGQLAMSGAAAIGTPTDTGISGVDGLALGDDHGCATIGGVLRCWGDNAHGQLGDGTTTSHSMPLPTTTNLTGVAAGYDFTCGINGATVECWGSNARDKLGGIAGADVLTPTSNGVPATNIDLGVDHACVLDGTAATCWGWNERAQLGRGTQTAMEPPGAVSGTTTWAALTTGAEHTCGASSTGGLHCWGMNVHGMLGTGDGDDRLVPAEIAAGGGREITARKYHTCAEINGAPHCWGYNVFGQIGNGTAENVYSPTPVDAPAGVTLFALGDDFSCVLSTDTKVRCWGDNTYGQLGLGVVGFVPAPFTVPLP